MYVLVEAGSRILTCCGVPDLAVAHLGNIQIPFNANKDLGSHGILKFPQHHLRIRK